MMDILEYFKLPSMAKIKQRVFTKDIVAALDAQGSEKSVLEKSIASVYLEGIINEETTGLWNYEEGNYVYQEVQLFRILLKDKSKVKTLNELIQRVFPNPIIVIYEYGVEFLLSTAMKRLHKVEKGKMVVDSIQTTDWFRLDQQHVQLLSKIQLNQKNLRVFYESIDFILSAEYIVKVMGVVPEVVDFSIKAKSLAIQQLLEEKSKWQNAELEATSMQAKMQCHIKIKEIENKLEAFR